MPDVPNLGAWLSDEELATLDEYAKANNLTREEALNAAVRLLPKIANERGACKGGRDEPARD